LERRLHIGKWKKEATHPARMLPSDKFTLKKRRERGGEVFPSARNRVQSYKFRPRKRGRRLPVISYGFDFRERGKRQWGGIHERRGRPIFQVAERQKSGLGNKPGVVAKYGPCMGRFILGGEGNEFIEMECVSKENQKSHPSGGKEENQKKKNPPKKNKTSWKVSQIFPDCYNRRMKRGSPNGEGVGRYQDYEGGEWRAETPQSRKKNQGEVKRGKGGVFYLETYRIRSEGKKGGYSALLTQRCPPWEEKRDWSKSRKN